MDSDLFVFAHIPKTGGQTLRNHFIKHLRFHDEFIHLGPYGIAEAEKLGLPPFDARPVEQRQRARVILGHNVTQDTHTLVPGRTSRHITFLREPAEMLVSYYNFQAKQDRLSGNPVASFEQWYDASKRNNIMTGWIYTYFMMRPAARVTPTVWADVVETLEGFWFVGVTECMNQDAPQLLRHIGVPTSLEPANVSGVHYPKTLSLTPELREQLNAENRLDWDLYDRWRQRRQSRDATGNGISASTA